jgi:hypothetical protein
MLTKDTPELRTSQVFKVIWTDPAGQANFGKTRNSTHFSTVWLGEQTSVRSDISWWCETREPSANACKNNTFHVPRVRLGYLQVSNTPHSPIQTYGKKGATKTGLVMKDHGIIHTTPQSPNPLQGEHLVKRREEVRGKAIN